MALKAILALSLLAGTAGHPDDLEEPERRLRGNGRSSSRHIWGGNSQEKLCTYGLSDGPADADVEIRLGGLTASAPGQAVHLHWWAPRKSATAYEPLVSAVNCSVYRSMLDAYPRYTDGAFNGGNVRVSESGEAVIRVRAPSTYYMWRCIAIPHIHLRLCRGTNHVRKASDAIMLAGHKVWVSSGCRRRRRPIHVISAHPYAARNASASPGSSGPQPRIVIRGVTEPEDGTTTLPQGTTTELLAAVRATTTVPPAGATTKQVATAQATTTTVLPAGETTTALPADGMRGVQISTARDALDLDALEFSPVYNCLLQRQFFDHFSDSCAQDCPVSADVAHGQCVRAENAEPQAQLEVSWQLSIDCGTPCWHDKKNVTLHNVRLEIAGHLDIPFQEIEVLTGFSTSTSRRLAATRTAYLTVKVASNRIAAAEGGVLLSSFPQDAASMTTLLGLDVLSVTAGSAPNRQADPTSMNQRSDPYVPAYSDLEGGPRSGASSDSPLGFLPAEAIIGIAAGVTALGAAFGVALCYRRRRQRWAQAQAQQAKKVEDNVIVVTASKSDVTI